MSVEEPILSEEELERLSAKGRALYQERLKSLLEPAHNGDEVAIHLDSGDYEVGPRRARPHFTLRRRHPEGGYIMLTPVGPPEPDDLLTLRIAAGKLMTDARK